MANVRVERSETTAVVTMTRGERRNALSLEMMRDLTRAFGQIAEEREVRAVILAGEGPAFSAGHDLRELRSRDDGDYREIFDACVELMEMIQGIPQPVIAEVAGVATAAGCQLVATCDLAVAAEEARFATPGVRIGLFCSTPMVAISRTISRKRTMEMLLTGEMIPASTALSWGLVNRVVPAESLRPSALELAKKIAQASGEIVALGKAAFYRQADLGQTDAYAYTKEVMVRNAQLDNAQEGIGAFVERRQPVWHS